MQHSKSEEVHTTRAEGTTKDMQLEEQDAQWGKEWDKAWGRKWCRWRAQKCPSLLLLRW